MKDLHGNTTRMYRFTHLRRSQVHTLALILVWVLPPPPTTVHRRAGVVKWKLYIACRCEIECVCHLCVSSVMEWQHVRGLPASSHTVHAEIIMTSLWPWGGKENGIMDEILEKTEQCTRVLSFKRKKSTSAKKSSLDNSYTNTVQKIDVWKTAAFLRINYIIFQPENYPLWLQPMLTLYL